jgi:hypothetical protein
MIYLTIWSLTQNVKDLMAKDYEIMDLKNVDGSIVF